MTTFMKRLLRAAVFVGCSASVHAQQVEPELDACLLNNYKSSHQVVLDGTVSNGAHEIFLHLPGCKYPVVIEYPSELLESERGEVPPLRQDDNLNRLNSELRDHPMRPVGVSLFGRLDVAKPIPEGATVRLGMLFGPSGKYLGPYGFGHPTGVYKYRLVLIQVNAVVDAAHDK